MYRLAGFVGVGILTPVFLGMKSFIREYFHYIATPQSRGNGFETAVDTGIFGMVAKFGVEFISEVYYCGALRENHLLPLGVNT